MYSEGLTNRLCQHPEPGCSPTLFLQKGLGSTFFSLFPDSVIDLFRTVSRLISIQGFGALDTVERREAKGQ